VKVTVTVVQSYRRLATKDDDQLLAAVAEVVHELRTSRLKLPERTA